MGVLRQMEGGAPAAELCREHGMSSATLYKRRAKYAGMEASGISEMKAMAEENRRLKRMFAGVSMPNDLLKEALGEKMKRPAQRREPLGTLASRNALTVNGCRESSGDGGGSISLACRTLDAGGRCYR